MQIQKPILPEITNQTTINIPSIQNSNQPMVNLKNNFQNNIYSIQNINIQAKTQSPIQNQILPPVANQPIIPNFIPQIYDNNHIHQNQFQQYPNHVNSNLQFQYPPNFPNLYPPVNPAMQLHPQLLVYPPPNPNFPTHTMYTIPHLYVKFPDNTETKKKIDEVSMIVFRVIKFNWLIYMIYQLSIFYLNLI